MIYTLGNWRVLGNLLSKRKTASIISTFMPCCIMRSIFIGARPSKLSTKNAFSPSGFVVALTRMTNWVNTSVLNLSLYFPWEVGKHRIWLKFELTGWKLWVILTNCCISMVDGCGRIYFVTPSTYDSGFPRGSVGKESACNAGDLGLIPGSGRDPGEGNSNPLQYSCLENSMDEGARQGTVHGIAKNQTRLCD